MKHNFRKAMAASLASLAILAAVPMQNGISDLVLPITASATGDIEMQLSDGIKLTFKLNDTNNTCKVTESTITKANAVVEIPDTITANGKTYTVTSIGYMAFCNQKKLRCITGEAKHISSIEAGAFMGCDNLWDIHLFNGTFSDGNPKGTIENIGDSAFKDCTALKDSHFLQNVKNIGAWAFWGSNINSAFLRDVYSIGEAAFYNCTNLSTIDLCGNHLKTIPDFAFYNCCKANYINICNSVKTIGKSAFTNCDRVEELSLPASVKKIDTGAFMNCDRLKNVKTIKVEEIKDHAFFNCPKIIRFESNYKDTALGEYSLGYNYVSSLFKNTELSFYAPSGGSVEDYADHHNFFFFNKN